MFIYKEKTQGHTNFKSWQLSVGGRYREGGGNAMPFKLSCHGGRHMEDNILMLGRNLLQHLYIGS